MKLTGTNSWCQVWHSVNWTCDSRQMPAGAWITWITCLSERSEPWDADFINWYDKLLVVIP